ncbi:MAG TPA: hypothetical protein VK512_17965 [Xanthobacteraceae bacterium]|nr:hypothetical protein [Xanthobacteraceae bacterium]
MVIAVIAVWVMKLPVHEIVDVIAMRDGFVPAVRAVLVRAMGFRRATRWVLCGDGDDMLVNVILMHVVKVAIMKIVHMALMPDCGVAAARAVLMRVIEMMFLGTCHIFPFRNDPI